LRVHRMGMKLKKRFVFVEEICRSSPY
jgi:hypothetical protein